MARKKTKAKVKNVTQTVTVNIHKGKKSSAPTQSRPTPLQQALQFAQAIRGPGESLIQSQQILQRMIDPLNSRLDVLMRQQVPNINIAPPSVNIAPPSVNIAPPSVNIAQRFPNINVQPANVNVPVNVQPANVNVPVNVQPANVNVPVNVQPANVNVPVNVYNPRPMVLDQPDAPLVTPPPPLIPAGPERLDDPHEDVPIEELSEEAVSSSAATSGDFEPGELPMPSTVDLTEIPNTRTKLAELPVIRKGNMKYPNKPTLREIARHYGIQLNRGILKRDILDRIYTHLSI